jgi:hypothetical protein
MQIPCGLMEFFNTGLKKQGGGGQGTRMVSFNALCILHGMKSYLMTLTAATKNDEYHE